MPVLLCLGILAFVKSKALKKGCIKICILIQPLSDCFYVFELKIVSKRNREVSFFNRPVWVFGYVFKSHLVVYHGRKIAEELQTGTDFQTPMEFFVLPFAVITIVVAFVCLIFIRTWSIWGT